MKYTGFLILLLAFTGCGKRGTDAIIPVPDDLKDSAIKLSAGYVKTHPVSVIGLGFPSFKSTDLLDKVPLIINESPDLVIIMCGTNDVVQNQYTDFYKNLKNLVDSVKKTKVDIILMSPPPLRNSEQNKHIIEANSTVKQVATEKGCFYLDLYSAFSARSNIFDDLFITDGVHPNNVGHKLIAKEVLTFYVKNNLSKNKIVCFGDSITFGSTLNTDGSLSGDTWPAYLYNLLNL